jgi:small-conductance mechanosensitive channel
MSGSPLDELTGDPRHIEWRKLPATVVMSLISLLAGAVVGPEGALGRFAAQIAAWYGERFRVPVSMRGRLVFASAASAYNGLLENPVFTAVLAGDMARGTPGIWASMSSNLLGGAIGFAIFQLLGGVGVADFLDLGPVPEGSFGDVLWVMGFAIVGMLLAVFAALSMQVAQRAFSRLDGQPVTRALVAGAIFSLVGLAAPILLFSGETQIKEILDEPSAYGFAALVALALAKIVLLASPAVLDCRSSDTRVISFIGVIGIVLYGANEVGIPALGLLAGLGIGGLAIGLVGQGTVENLIGGLTLHADRPFKVSDFVQLGDDLGTVEIVGPRSARIRKSDGTRLSVPNSDVAKSKVVNFTQRSNVLFLHTIGVRYGTTPEQLGLLVCRIADGMREHPLVVSDENMPRVAPDLRRGDHVARTSAAKRSDPSGRCGWLLQARWRSLVSYAAMVLIHEESDGTVAAWPPVPPPRWP